MIARRHRFHGHAGLRPVYQRGVPARASHMTIRVLANPRRRHYRAAVVVSRKVSKSAVVRNRIRRRIYEQLRTTVPAGSAYDIVVLIHQDSVATVAADRLAGDLQGLLLQASPSLNK